MKKMILSVLLLAGPAFASEWECEITSGCIKSISPCEVNKLVTEYTESTKSIHAYAEFVLAWQLDKMCISKKGKVMQYKVANGDVVQEMDYVLLNELRLPEKMEEVPSHYISNAENKALKKCQYTRNNLIKMYERCK